MPTSVAVPRLVHLQRMNVQGRAVASSGNPVLAVDGDPTTCWQSSDDAPQWLAVPLEVPADGELLVLVQVADIDFVNYLFGPRSFTIEVSEDSTDGRDGCWRTARRVVDSRVRSRVDRATARGACWVRLAIDEMWYAGVSIRELAVYGVAGGAIQRQLDSWTILGDSITAQSFDPGKPNRFSEIVHEADPSRFPLLVGAGTGGDTSVEGLQRLCTMILPSTPPGGFIGLAYGGGDTIRRHPVVTYKANMRQLIEIVLGSERTPVVPRFSFNLIPGIEAHLEAIDALNAEYGLLPGPDLYTWFKDHREQFVPDRIHLQPDGERAVQRLWAEVAIKAAAR